MRIPRCVDGRRPVIDDGLGFPSICACPDTTALLAYRAKPHTGVIDLTSSAQ